MNRAAEFYANKLLSALFKEHYRWKLTSSFRRTLATSAHRYLISSANQKSERTSDRSSFRSGRFQLDVQSGAGCVTEKVAEGGYAPAKVCRLCTRLMTADFRSNERALVRRVSAAWIRSRASWRPRLHRYGLQISSSLLQALRLVSYAAAPLAPAEASRLVGLLQPPIGVTRTTSRGPQAFV